MIKQPKLNASNLFLMGFMLLACVIKVNAQTLRPQGSSNTLVMPSIDSLSLNAQNWITQEAKRQSSDFIVALVDSEPVTNQENIDSNAAMVVANEQPALTSPAHICFTQRVDGESDQRKIAASVGGSTGHQSARK
jgi:hypothetical protein